MGKYYLYFLTDGEHIKIGYTADVAKRISMMQTGNARPITLVKCFELQSKADALFWEKRLHEIFRDKRMCGEWFDIANNDDYLEIVQKSSLQHILPKMNEWCEKEYCAELPEAFKNCGKGGKERYCPAVIEMLDFMESKMPFCVLTYKTETEAQKAKKATEVHAKRHSINCASARRGNLVLLTRLTSK